MSIIDNSPVCTFNDTCIFRKEGKCSILTTMPKAREEGVCPFSKKHYKEVKVV